MINLLHCWTLTDHPSLSVNINGRCGCLDVFRLVAGIRSARHEVQQLPLIDRFCEVSIGALLCGIDSRLGCPVGSDDNNRRGVIVTLDVLDEFNSVGIP